MPSKKRGKAWTDEDITTLLAYLDYYVTQRNEEGAWSKEKLLPKLAKHLRSRSKNQITQKLCTLWKHSSTSSSKTSFDDLFRCGSRCLPNLSMLQRSCINDEMKAIEIDERNQFLNTPQTLRSGKQRSISIEVSQHNPRFVTSKTASRRKRPSRRSRRINFQPSVSTPSEQNDIMAGDFLSPSRDPSPSARRAACVVKKELVSLSDSTNSAPENAASTRARTPPEHARGEVADSYGESSETEAVELEQDLHQSGFRLITRARLDLTDEPQAYTTDNDKIQSNQEMLQKVDAHRVYEALRGLLDGNAHLRRECVRLEEANNSLARELRLRQSLSLLPAEDSLQSMLYTIKMKEDRLKSLEKHLVVQDFREKFSKPSTSNPDLLKEARSTLEKLTHCMYGLATVEEFFGESVHLIQNNSEALEPLLRRSLAHGSHQLSTEVNSGDKRLPGMIMMSLVGAAVCEWVFLQDTVCAPLLSSPLLDRYREHLEVFYAQELLHSIDLAARYSIVHEEGFCEIYSRHTAAALARKLLATLTLIGTNFAVSAQRNEVRGRLEDIFSHALAIKYYLIPSKDKFDIIWPTPDSDLDESCMVVYPPISDSNSRNLRRNNASKIQLTIVPGIIRYFDSRKLNDYDAFRKADEVLGGNSEVLARASVSLRPMNLA